MKKKTAALIDQRKLALRVESVATLSSSQLAIAAGASVLAGCTTKVPPHI